MSVSRPACAIATDVASCAYIRYPRPQPGDELRDEEGRQLDRFYVPMRSNSARLAAKAGYYWDLVKMGE